MTGRSRRVVLIVLAVAAIAVPTLLFSPSTRSGGCGSPKSRSR